MWNWWKSLEMGHKIGLLSVLVAVIGILVSWASSQGGITNIYSGTGDNVAGDKITINNEYDEEKLKKLANDLAQQYREQDAETIKELEQTVIALSQQDQDKYDIDEALNLLSEGKPEEAEKIFELVALEAREKGQEAKQKWAKKEAAALRHIGSLAFLHNTQKALDSYQRSTELDPDNLSGWNQLGHLYRRIGELENAENAYTNILKLVGSDQAWQAAAYGNLGLVYRTRGDLDQAVEFYQKSLAINQELGRKEGMAADYGNLGIVYRTRGDLDQAVDYWKKSLALFTKVGAAREIEVVQSLLDDVGQ